MVDGNINCENLGNKAGRLYPDRLRQFRITDVRSSSPASYGGRLYCQLKGQRNHETIWITVILLVIVLAVHLSFIIYFHQYEAAG